MSRILIAFATLGLAIGAAHAQGDNSMNNAKAPGTTGAMKTPTAPGVATDPQQVQAQQGDAAKSSAGTVGAAPGADTQSQKPADKK
ncbi:hypothetical protein RHAL1_02178 [Beijerinckiaceae bacterium RH AL1]|nr:hypothetical protein [Beijerinckiaceae bacterium]VVB46217.1 hypothetical protein RHCH11_RHCH11_02134 [Beijerinckiaceae bacterium RH CH11]VVB46302.1 hypothetical protein RHAL8_02130 [Beijerinckiaceae bacterium RH AL8]VVC55263.1 hypothetical protein RHAL1_02178 [Beijerinckiaceae bacterium RH AL1]